MSFSWLFLVKIFVAAFAIALSSWLANRYTAIAGYIIALPLTTMLALIFAQGENPGGQVGVELAKSVLISLPFTVLFFVPFLVSERFKLGFWSAYSIGVFLTILAAPIQQKLFDLIKK